MVLGLCLVCILGIVCVKPIVVEKHYDLQLPPYYANEQSKFILSNQLETYRNDIRQEYKANQEALDKKIDFFLAILSIAIAVWIGLNIYNYLDRKDLEKLTKDYNDLLVKANELEEKIKENTEKLDSSINTVTERIETLEQSDSGSYEKIKDKFARDLMSQIRAKE